MISSIEELFDLIELDNKSQCVSNVELKAAIDKYISDKARNIKAYA